MKLGAQAIGTESAISMPTRSGCVCALRSLRNIQAMPSVGAPAAAQVLLGTGSFKKVLARTVVRSGARLITTNVFAVVVNERAIMKVVNISAQRPPEMIAGRAIRNGFFRSARRTTATKTNANRLR